MKDELSDADLEQITAGMGKVALTKLIVEVAK